MYTEIFLFVLNRSKSGSNENLQGELSKRGIYSNVGAFFVGN